MIHRDTQDHENNKVFSEQRGRFGAVVKIQIFAFVVAFLTLLCMTGIGSAVVYHEDEVITTDTTWAVDVHVINASPGFFDWGVQVNEGVTLTNSGSGIFDHCILRYGGMDSDYLGENTDGDGLGDTLLPYNSSGDITNGGDYHPLVPVGGLTCTCGDICVNETGWWRDGSAFQPSDTPIQSAVDNATVGDTICVTDGTYTENVDVNKRLTIRSENGAASTTVNALNPSYHVFKVRENHVTISGFTVTGAAAYGNAGIYVNSVDYCIISDNIASNNAEGIFIKLLSDCTLTNNIALNNAVGISLRVSSNNCMLDSNTAISNNITGIILFDSHGNTIDSNTVTSNNAYGIYLKGSGYNTIYNNYFNNTNNAYDDGINIWNISKTAGTNIIGGSWLGGNYWSDYAGEDRNGDGLGDTLLPYNSSGDIIVGGDYHPLLPL